MCKDKIIKRAVGYVRISSESQLDNTSIDYQKEKIKEYCKLYNYELVHIFIDNAKSGSNIENRDGYREMIKFISSSQNEINALVTLKSDRLHRSLKNLLIMIEQLEQLHVAFISITESFDTSTSQGTLLIQMLGSFSEFEKKLINERTKSGRIRKAQNNKFCGGRVPYGYRLINGNTVDISPIEADTVRYIFKAKSLGDSLQKIMDYLNEHDIKNCNGSEWNRQSIDFILKNPSYLGKYKYDGDKEKNNITINIPRIITTQLFKKVNEKK